MIRTSPHLKETQEDQIETSHSKERESGCLRGTRRKGRDASGKLKKIKRKGLQKCIRRVTRSAGITLWKKKERGTALENPSLLEGIS